MNTDLPVVGQGSGTAEPLQYAGLRDAGPSVAWRAAGADRAHPAAVSPRLSRYPLRSQRALLLAWMILTDAVALGAAFALAYWIRFDLQITLAPEIVGSSRMYIALGAVLIPLWLLAFLSFNLYDVHARAGGIEESARTFNACAVAAMIVVTATFLVPSLVIARMWLVSAWALSFCLVSGNRFVIRRLVRALRASGYLLAPAIIVGTNEEAVSVAAFLGDRQTSGVSAVGFVSTEAPDGGTPAALPTLGSTTEIAHIVRAYRVEDVIVAITSVNRDELLRLCEDVDALPVVLRLSSGLYELLTTRVTVHTLGTVPLMSLQKNRLTGREGLMKAVLDKSLALAGLTVLSPLMFVVAVAIKLDSPGPVIHRRRVLGPCGRDFDAFKFRTMVVNGGEVLARRPGATRELRENHKLKDDPRVTRTGRWLRRFSLDELPQLVNVLLGQMSLVGPRMITAVEAEKYGRNRLNLLTVKPGITGLWQVSGRSDVGYEERVRMDMYYVRNYSMWLDLQILFVRTIPAVLKGRGAY